MAARIPDLWQLKEDAERLYSLYLSYLMQARRNEEIVSACRQIRRYSVRGPGLRKGLFTFWREIEALCELKRYQIAWRQLRRYGVNLLGKRLDLTRLEETPTIGLSLEFHYAPLLYFLGRYPL